MRIVRPIDAVEVMDIFEDAKCGLRETFCDGSDPSLTKLCEEIFEPLIEELRAQVEKLPTVKAYPINNDTFAYWVETGSNNNQYYYCSRCHASTLSEHPYCHNCGSTMVDEVEMKQKIH